jgi:Rod binding domain-containing protein
MAGAANVSAPQSAIPLHGDGAAAKRDTPEKIANAAKQFESLLIAQMLKSMHEGGSQGWLSDGEDQSSDSTMEMAEEQFAQAMASGGGLGLSRLITQDLSKESDRAAEAGH